MKHLPLVARVVLGLLFLVVGLAGLLHQPPDPATGTEPDGLRQSLFSWYSDCRPCPPGMAPEPVAFMEGLLATGYFWPLLKVVEIVCGALLMSGMFVPLALVVLAPIVLQVLLFHIFLVPQGLGIALTALVLGTYVAYHHRSSFRGVLRRTAPPGARGQNWRAP